MFKCLWTVYFFGLLLLLCVNLNESSEEEVVNSFIEIPSSNDYSKLFTTNKKYQQVTKQVLAAHWKNGSCFPKFNSKEFKASDYTRKEIPTNLQTLTVLYGSETLNEIDWTKRFLLKEVERPLQLSYNSFPTTMKFANILFVTEISTKKNEIMSFFKKAEQYFGTNRQYNIIILDLSKHPGDMKVLQQISEKVKYIFSPISNSQINNSLVVPIMHSSLQPRASLLLPEDRKIDFLLCHNSDSILSLVSSVTDNYYVLERNVKDLEMTSHLYRNSKFTISKDKKILQEAISFGSIPILSESSFTDMIKFVHNGNLLGLVDFLNSGIKNNATQFREYQKQTLDCWENYSFSYQTLIQYLIDNMIGDIPNVE